MEGYFVGPIMDKIINAFSDYLKEQIGWQRGINKKLDRLRENLPKIQAVVFAANQAQIIDESGAVNECIWQLRNASDEADDALDEFLYTKHTEQLTENTEETKKRNISIFKFISPSEIRNIYPTLKHKQELTKNAAETKKRKFTSFLFGSPRKFLKIGERGLKRDPKLKRLEEALQKLDKASTDVTTFLPLLDSAKQEQKDQKQQLGRETGFLHKNDLIGRSKEKEFVMEWLRKPSNEPGGTDFYRNIALLSIVGFGGMGKTALLQHVYKDVTKKEFDLTMWVCVSNNFDVNKVIADMLECLQKKRPCLETLGALQDSLGNAVWSKKFLLILDGIWEVNGDIIKWEDVLAPLADGKIGSRILVTTRTDSAAMMIATVIQKKTEIFRLEGLEEDKCLQLLNFHACVENRDDDHHERLRAIAGEKVKKLLGSPLAAKVIGGVLKESLDEEHWRKVLESNLFRRNSINSILRLSYMALPNHLQNCFAFCSIFKQDYIFDKDDLVQMWIALGFIQRSLDQEETMEDIGGKVFDVLVKANFFYKFGRYYKMHDLTYELARSVFIHESLRLQDDTKFPSIISQNLRHLSVKTGNSNILRKFGNLKYLRSLFLCSKASNQDLCNALIEIFEASRGLRVLYVYAPSLEMIPEEIGNLIHLRYLKIICKDLNKLPRSLSNLYHLQ